MCLCPIITILPFAGQKPPTTSLEVELKLKLTQIAQD